jgi:hypothetical protein
MRLIELAVPRGMDFLCPAAQLAETHGIIAGQMYLDKDQTDGHARAGPDTTASRSI